MKQERRNTLKDEEREPNLEEVIAPRAIQRAQTVKTGNNIKQAMLNQDKEINNDAQSMINDLDNENLRPISNHVSFRQNIDQGVPD